MVLYSVYLAAFGWKPCISKKMQLFRKRYICNKKHCFAKVDIEALYTTIECAASEVVSALY